MATVDRSYGRHDPGWQCQCRALPWGPQLTGEAERPWVVQAHKAPTCPARSRKPPAPRPGPHQIGRWQSGRHCSKGQGLIVGGGGPGTGDVEPAQGVERRALAERGEGVWAC
jgi:hypothetical protein